MYQIELPSPPPPTERYVQLLPCLRVEPSPITSGPDIESIQWQEPNGENHYYIEIHLGLAK